MFVFDEEGVVIGEMIEINGAEVFRSTEEMIKKLGLSGCMNALTGEHYRVKGLDPVENLK